MKNEFPKFIQSIHKLSPTSLESLIKLFVQKQYKAKDTLTESGKVPKKTFFLNSGILRSYIITEKEKEYTRRIYSKPTMFSSYTALIKNKESLFTLECLTDCDIMEANYSELIQLAESDLEVAKFIRISIENLFVSYSERNARFLTLDASQRYIQLRQKIPNIDTLIQQKQIALNLGITSIQLSRIRKKLIQNNS